MSIGAIFTDLGIIAASLAAISVQRANDREKKQQEEAKQPKKVITYTYDEDYKMPDISPNLKHHLTWGTRSYESILNRLELFFNSYDMPYKVEQVNRSVTITQVLITLYDLKDYTKVVKLEAPLRAALNMDGIRISQKGAYLSLEIPFAYDDLELGDELLDPEFMNREGYTLAIGQGIDGKYVYEDLRDLKHILVAGATGSGKSVFVHGLILSLLAKHTPKDLEMYMIDPKMVEFGPYNALAWCHVVTDTYEAETTLQKLCTVMDERYSTLYRDGCRDIDSYNEKHPEAPMKRIVLVVDELADIMMTNRKGTESYIVRIAQKARAAGIHMILATQHPNRQVVSPLIKANMPTKVCLSVTSATASVVILGKGGAEKLVGKGDMLFQTERSEIPARLQGGIVNEQGIKNIVYDHYQNQHMIEKWIYPEVPEKRSIFG